MNSSVDIATPPPTACLQGVSVNTECATVVSKATAPASATPDTQANTVTQVSRLFLYLHPTSKASGQGNQKFASAGLPESLSPTAIPTNFLEISRAAIWSVDTPRASPPESCSL